MLVGRGQRPCSQGRARTAAGAARPVTPGCNHVRDRSRGGASRAASGSHAASPITAGSAPRPLCARGLAFERDLDDLRYDLASSQLTQHALAHLETAPCLTRRRRVQACIGRDCRSRDLRAPKELPPRDTKLSRAIRRTIHHELLAILRPEKLISTSPSSIWHQEKASPIGGPGDCQKVISP